MGEAREPVGINPGERRLDENSLVAHGEIDTPAYSGSVEDAIGDEDDVLHHLRDNWTGMWLANGVRSIDELIGDLESEAAWLREAASAGVKADEEAGCDAGWFPLVAPTLEVARRFWRRVEVPAGVAVPQDVKPLPRERASRPRPPAGPCSVLEWTGRFLADEVGTVEELAGVLEREAARLREMKEAGVEVDPDLVLSEKEAALVTHDPAVAERFGFEEQESDVDCWDDEADE